MWLRGCSGWSLTGMIQGIIQGIKREMCLLYGVMLLHADTSMHSDPHSHTHTHTAEDIMTALVNKPKPITTEYINHSSVLFHYVKSSHSEGTVQSQVDL